ncbi:restriction endonuclease subunit S, partial [Paenibacillus sp. GCM10012303]|uniref:restriction endonuclease subunit S n=1 Tax=Paenibacillus sp. GCM10012303 TaxID=3317340 RepID=UPI00361E47A2
LKHAELNQKGTGSTFKAINKQNLSEIICPLPPLETQKQIAKTLDTAAELLAMRKQQLVELDNLIKSTFNDMFGDPVTNEKGWNLKAIGDFSVVKIGPFGSLLHVEDYIEGGFPLVNPSHIVGNKIVPDMRLTLSKEKFKELKSYSMKTGDIVVGRRGEIGRCAVVDDEGFLCGTGSMFIRIENDYLPMMLQRIISSDAMRARLEHQSVGVTMKNLNAGTISNLVVPMIPLHLQIQFANIITKIEEQKALVKKAIDETQYLFDSLMSEYFE